MTPTIVDVSVIFCDLLRQQEGKPHRPSPPDIADAIAVGLIDGSDVLCACVDSEFMADILVKAGKSADIDELIDTYLRETIKRKQQ